MLFHAPYGQAAGAHNLADAAQVDVICNERNPARGMEGGMCIVATHLGKGFRRDGSRIWGRSVFSSCSLRGTAGFHLLGSCSSGCEPNARMMDCPHENGAGRNAGGRETR